MSPELAALAVHDLKNALGSLEGQLLALEADPQPAAARSARALCEQLRRETVAFLTLYRGESLRAVVEDESPQDLLRSLLPRDAAVTDPVRVELAEPAGAPSFWYFDPRLVRLALDAALHNARRYARSRVELAVEQRDEGLVFSVTDDGPGLAATAATRSAWTTGLGTELCRAVARAHHNGERRGRIELFDCRQGDLVVGARFELVLP